MAFKSREFHNFDDLKINVLGLPIDLIPRVGEWKLRGAEAYFICWEVSPTFCGTTVLIVQCNTQIILVACRPRQKQKHGHGTSGKTLPVPSVIPMFP